MRGGCHTETALFLSCRACRGILLTRFRETPPPRQVGAPPLQGEAFTLRPLLGGGDTGEVCFEFEKVRVRCFSKGDLCFTLPTISSVYHFFPHKNRGLCSDIKGDKNAISFLLHSVLLQISLVLLSRDIVSNHSFVSVENVAVMKQNIFYLRYIHTEKRAILYLWNDKA